VNLLALLENGLFALGQVLRFPVMALLWVCVGAVLFMAGGALVDFLSRRRERRGFDVERWLREGSVLGADADRLSRLPQSLRHMVTEIAAAAGSDDLAAGGLEHIVLAHEARARTSITGSRMLVRVGPSLGLIGTLIPMGTALAALATGNLEAMSGQMIVAFTTTIIGISCGTVAFVITTVRQTWVTETLREQRFVAERVAAELAVETAPETAP